MDNQGKKPLKYELILIFEHFKGFKPKQIFDMLPPNYVSKMTLYNYHARYKDASKKLDKIISDWAAKREMVTA
jgi:hypothetical protein